MAHKKLTYTEWCFKYAPDSRITMMAGNSPSATPVAPHPILTIDIAATSKRIAEDLFKRLHPVMNTPPEAAPAPAAGPEHHRYALTGKRVDGVEEPETEAAAEFIDPETVLCEQRARADYAKDSTYYMRAGVSEADFITSRKIDAGLETLVVR
jgi:hypothetical protein